jgi:hypothetical protein
MIEINGPSYRRIENLENSDDSSDIESSTPVHSGRRRGNSSSSMKRARRAQRAFVFLFVIIVFLVLYIPISQNMYRQKIILQIPGWSFNTSRDVSILA